jgi:hypothetical protein
MPATVSEEQNPLATKPLQDWRAAEDQAARQNRNLMQYAAAAATVLGIGGGSGGLFAVADSLVRTGKDPIPSWLYAVVLGVTLIAACLLSMMAVAAMKLRGDAEDTSRLALHDLIQIDQGYATLKD